MSEDAKSATPKLDSLLGRQLRTRTDIQTELKTLTESIFDAASLEESLFWHCEIVERIDLEVIALLISDNERDQTSIPMLRKLQASHAKVIKNLRALIARGEALSWP